MSLREQYVDLEEAHSTLSRETAHTIATQTAEITTLSRQVEVLTGQLQEFKHIADERTHALDELQEKFDDLSVAQTDASFHVNDDENWGVIREELHRQASHLRTVEAENAKLNGELTTLRQRHANIEVLKEQKRELERKARGVDELREQVVRLALGTMLPEGNGIVHRVAYFGYGIELVIGEPEVIQVATGKSGSNRETGKGICVAHAEILIGAMRESDTVAAEQDTVRLARLV